ncbi:4-hydroxythreonine-4-phosphate dehydrogenase PdxA [Ferrovum sp. PN-J185]|uniref:4-hydroxythreonine-4-phosphate dehydrogenase PdxA n=1 Tax=Ferrovum sp. PN-J185 TaxID=1356306 RepID=UPI000792CAC2|nr:4-hydroxythreonine-4-phosphate dehydrogenase PdxA [Ferrovum sp. PN-J185]KXW55504.1 4-hydroxythreonine-4-phosphate dehydrogenase [Ferrovum sp. PN-J185]MCC6067939.1 4-hydroxythreonine-4-phosphate dehydrogenase PdxA [Ferrovum sp. PN-J185]
MSTSDSMTSNSQKIIGLSVGEPAGIGPDLAVMIAQERDIKAQLVLCADKNMLIERAAMLAIPFEFEEFDPHNPHQCHSHIAVWHHPCEAPVTPGSLNVLNANYVLQALTNAAQYTYQGIFHALVTGPIQKSIIEESGIIFTGHTEYLAQQFSIPKVVMLLVGGELKVALATTHIPLKEVAQSITEEDLFSTLQILHRELKTKFNIPDPRIKVAGLNPHAGEDGHLGDEEIRVISPTIQRCQLLGQRIEGPFSADTLFLEDSLQGVDCVLAMYHDQGLPVLKTTSFGRGVNITLGLPIIRTSVDHGTALSLAGKKNAHIDAGSLKEAINTALHMNHK